MSELNLEEKKNILSNIENNRVSYGLLHPTATTYIPTIRFNGVIYKLTEHSFEDRELAEGVAVNAAYDLSEHLKFIASGLLKDYEVHHTPLSDRAAALAWWRGMTPEAQGRIAREDKPEWSFNLFTSSTSYILKAYKKRHTS